METSAHVQPCLDCHRACTEAVTNLLHGRISPGYDESVHLVVLLDCAHICVVCADFMTRGSVHHKHVCRVCDEICEGCARSAQIQTTFLALRRNMPTLRYRQPQDR